VPNAQGAFGTVFQGEDEAGNRRAIKKMKMSAAIDNLRAIYPNLPNPRGHMAREWSCTLLELSHPNLCRTFAVEFTDRAGRRSDLANCEFAYLVMEWAGEALIDVVLARGGLREFESRGYFYQILVGIQALHARGIAHRDIKPENVTLGEPAPGEQLGVIKIVDFGLAKSASQGPPISDVGTPRYKAPEIATSCRRGLLYNDKVDVWSLGCTLYEMLTAKGSMANKRDGVGRMVGQPAQRSAGQGCVPALLWVRVEIMRSSRCRIVGKFQSVLIMINPMIFPRTRRHVLGGPPAV
jgi:serine/threonine protein kinase